MTICVSLECFAAQKKALNGIPRGIQRKNNCMIVVYKQGGELLSELLVRVRKEHDIEDAVPLTYAGRLDPLVEGVVLMFAGDDVHQKDLYTKLPKQYTFDVLFGVGTDTHDPLGIIYSAATTLVNTQTVRNIAEDFVGVHSQRYPLYSSKPVDGVPLFAHARAGNSVEQPSHDVEMFQLQTLEERYINGELLAEQAVERVAQVNGDFRQANITAEWVEFGKAHESQEFLIMRFVATVGSGFYIRQFAHDLGEKLNVPALAWWIRRDRVGDYTL